MKLYTDTDLDNDIRCVKDIMLRYTGIYKNFEHNLAGINRTACGRISFILSQFGGIFKAGRA